MRSGKKSENLQSQPPTYLPLPHQLSLQVNSMALLSAKKRKLDEGPKRKPHRSIKKFRKQTHYDSSSSANENDEFPVVDLADSDSVSNSKSDSQNSLSETEKPSKSATTTPTTQPQSFSSSSSASTSNSEFDSDNSFVSLSSYQPSKPARQKSKRNNPASFSASITSILNSKLSGPKRADPVLARSSTALQANTELQDAKLEKKAKQKLRAEKKEGLEKGRVKDVLLGTTSAIGDRNGDGERGGEESVGKMIEEEKRLKKTAQRGVVRLFNAVRAAQIKGEEARNEAASKGVVGSKRKEEKIGEMSKQGFLELVASGGSSKKVEKQMRAEAIEGG